MADYEISAKITADTSGFNAGIDNANKKTKSFSSQIKNVIKDISGGKGLTNSIGSAVLKMGAFGVAVGVATNAVKKVSSSVKECTQEYSKYISGQRVLQQTLKVTGAETWTNITALEKMQSEIQATTNYSSGEVQQLQTVLLGFKSIKGEVFEETTDAILDMATVMGMDLTNATQAVAKALDDPIKGLGSLSRQGFAFTEEQKKLIQSFIDAGETAKAQKVILDELNSTYGGASKSAVDSSKKMANAMSDLKKEMGATWEENLSPMRTYFAELIQGWANAKEAKRKYKEAENKSDETKTSDDTSVILEKKQKDLDAMNDRYSRALDLVKMTNDELKKTPEFKLLGNQVPVDTFRTAQEKIIENYSQMYTEVVALENEHNRLLEAEKKHKEEVEKQNEKLKEQNDLVEKRRLLEETVAGIKAEANKALAEQEAKWKATEEITGEVVSNQEKLEFYQNNLIDAVVEANGGISEGNQFYKDRMKIIEELNGKVQEERKIQAQLKGRAQAQKKYGDKVIKDREKEDEDEDEESAIAKIKRVTEKVTSITKTTVSAISKVVSGAINLTVKAIKAGFSAFKNLIDLNLGDVTETLLKFEDKVLTFFYSTINELPQFISTMLTSIMNLLEQLKDYVSKTDLVSVFLEIFRAISTDLPGVITELTTLVVQLLSDLITALATWIDEGGLNEVATAFFSGFEQLFQLLFVDLTGNESIQQGFSDLVVSLVDSLANIITILGDAFTNILDLAFTTLGDLVKSGKLQKLLDSLTGFVEKILDFFINNADTVIDTLMDVVMTIVMDSINKAPVLIPKIIEALGKLIGKLLEALLQALPDILVAIIKMLPDLIWKVIKAVWNAIVDIIAGFFKGLGWIAQGIWNGFRKLLGFAKGTNNAPGGLALVGERGPELVDLHGGERIYTAQNTRAILGGAGGSGGNTFNVTFNNTQDTTAYAMARQLRTYNRQMAINGVL